MNTIEITIGKTYSIKNGKTTIAAKVIDRDEEAQSWVCETENGKRFSLKDSGRFLAEVDADQPALPAPETSAAADQGLAARAAAAKIAAQFGFCTAEQADAIAAEAAAEAARLSAVAKDAAAKASAAKIAAEHGFCSAEIAEAAMAEAEAAKSALRAAGGSNSRGGGRTKGAMSGLDAAYKILLETGIPMNAGAITKAALEQGIWSPQGATPAMTLSAALQSDVKKKGDASRFAKATTPGHYIARAVQ
jgi:hypothetical protein